MSAPALFAQNPQTPPPAPTAPPAQDPQTPPAAQPEDWAGPEARKLYVRRFSAGVSLNVNVLTLMKSGTTTIEETALLAGHGTTAGKERIGGGITIQVGLMERLAVNASLIYRKMSYTASEDRLVGIDNSSTAADERKLTSSNESTRARYYDLPVLIRYYGRDHSESGNRWFFEGGATVRQVRSVRTHRDILLPDADETIGDDTPAAINKKNLLGLTMGLGGQFIDPIGIRVIPEIRYTRWLNTTFNNLSSVSRRDQIEGVISFTF